MLASGRASLVVISERTLAAPGVQGMMDALVSDGVLVRGANARNPRAYSLAGVSKGITESVRWDRPQALRVAEASQAAGFAGANGALSALGRGVVVAPVGAAETIAAAEGAAGAGVSSAGVQAAGATGTAAVVSAVRSGGEGISGGIGVSPTPPADQGASGQATQVAGLLGPVSPLATLPSILSLMPAAKREETLAALWASPGLRGLLLAEFGYAGPQADEESQAA